MELKGKVAHLLSKQSGQGKNGKWQKQEFILETYAQYPKKVCVALWGDKAEQFSVQEGETITAYIDVESREYNGWWYTDVKAWKIDKGQKEEPLPLPPNSDAEPDKWFSADGDGSEVLPF